MTITTENATTVAELDHGLGGTLVAPLGQGPLELGLTAHHPVSAGRPRDGAVVLAAAHVGLS